MNVRHSLHPMLAYLFWHTPAEGRDRSAYESALLGFQACLVAVGAAGLLAARTCRVDGLPWMPGAGYEDCYVVEDYAALGELNDAAVDARRIAAHDAVAHAAGYGAGALYALQAGDGAAASVHCRYLGKPPGVSYASFSSELAPLLAPAGASLWRRQLVLGPSPEFRLLSPTPVTLPQAFTAVACRLDALA